MGKKRRRNPVARKNPVESLKAVVGDLRKKDGKLPVWGSLLVGAVGGGAAMALGAAVGGKAGIAGNLPMAGVGLGSGIVGAALLDFIGRKVPKAAILRQVAPAVAAGAVTLTAWELLRQPTMDYAVTPLRNAIGLAGWTNEFDGLGQSYYDEFSTKRSAAGLGTPVTVPPSAGDNPFLAQGMSGYEQLGNVYDSQRLGSFERETGMGGFTPEVFNPANQQDADVAAHQAGVYGGLAGDASTLFVPFIESDD